MIYTHTERVGSITKQQGRAKIRMKVKMSDTNFTMLLQLKKRSDTFERWPHVWVINSCCNAITSHDNRLEMKFQP